MMKMPMITVDVCRNCDADRNIKPMPLVAATISAATNVVQPTPIPMRTAVMISGNAAGRITWVKTCHGVAPS